VIALGESPSARAGSREQALDELSAGRPDRAYELLRGYLAETLDLEAINNLAVIAHRLGRADEARMLLQAVILIEPARTDVAENLAALGDTQLDQAVSMLEQLVGAQQQLIEAQRRTSDRDHAFQTDAIAGMRRIHANEGWHRRRLRELRATPEHELAYTDPEPLISVVIPTYNRLELLRTRAIPSVLAQDYGNLEIVIVGDHSDYDVHDVTAGFEHAPISFYNLSMRGPYYEESHKAWLSAGTPPFNEAVARARGAWIAPFADDDEMRPNHLRILLDAARERRLEFAYGRAYQHDQINGDRVLGTFPPSQGQIVMQAGLLHKHLKMFELELADSDFGIPNDWAAVDRMIRAGVRIGMIDDILIDYYPSFARPDDQAGTEETSASADHEEHA
jgi:hypothetical protein